MKAGKKLKRYEDIGVYYDSDLGFRTPARQRVYKQPEGIIQTPLTDAFYARRVEPKCKLPRAKSFEHRYVNACYENPDNDTGESNLTVIVPYAPNDPVMLKQQIREIAAVTGVMAVAYFGESHTNTAKYFNRFQDDEDE